MSRQNYRKNLYFLCVFTIWFLLTLDVVYVIVYMLRYLCPFLDGIGIFTFVFERNVDMKKHLFKSLIAIALSLVICAMPAFAANTISFENGGISLDVYKDANGKVNEDYVKVTVKYTATRDEAAEEMSRITFALSATEPSQELAGNEAKVVYLDEQVTPTKDSTYSFVIEKTRIQSALEKENLADIEGLSLIFKMGGVGVEEAAVEKVVYNTPKDTMYGDVNGDDAIDFLDALMTLNYYAGNYELPVEKHEAADVNGDNSIDFLDALMILNCYAGNLKYEDMIGNR